MATPSPTFSSPSGCLAPILPHISPPSTDPSISTGSPIYILHLDTFPPAHKKRVFTLHLMLYLALTALMIYRLVYAFPFYGALLTFVFAPALRPETAGWTHTTRLLLVRAATMAFDYALFVQFGAPALWSFVAGPASWRWGTGFENVRNEIVVRRLWGATERSARAAVGLRNKGDETEQKEEGAAAEVQTLRGAAKKKAKAKAKEEVRHKQATSKDQKGSDIMDTDLWRQTIRAAVDSGLLYTRSGYEMVDRSWTLDYTSMVEVHRSKRNKELDMQALFKGTGVKARILIWNNSSKDEESGWKEWVVHEA